MSDNLFHTAVYLTGPTASGKTAVGAELARRLDAEIIALDSMTLYRGMDIATAKPSSTDRDGVPYHLIDVIDPWESASVSLFREWARQALADIAARGKRALFVGGTPLYLKVLLRGLFQGPAADVDLRARLECEAAEQGEAALHERLAAVDPRTAARLHPQDRRRIVRALEVFLLTGRPISELQAEHDRPAPPGVSVLALEIPRERLYARINARVPRFFEAGLVDEVLTLQGGARPLCDVAAQAIGYREVIEMLAGHGTLDQTIDRIQARTRQFAKRQGTWFRGLQEVSAVPIDPDQTAATIAVQLLARIESAPDFDRPSS